MVGLATDFQRACNEEKGFLLFTEAELDGVPQDVISGFEKVGDKFKMTYKSPDYVPTRYVSLCYFSPPPHPLRVSMLVEYPTHPSTHARLNSKYANLPATRKAAVLGYEGKTEKVNAPLLAEIVSLRRRAAVLLGKESWADHVLEVKMAKDSKTVFAFLADLNEKLRPLGIAEKQELLALKKEDCAERGIAYSDTLYLWDYRYYDRLFLEKSLSLGESRLSHILFAAHDTDTYCFVFEQMRKPSSRSSPLLPSSMLFLVSTLAC